MTEEQQKAIEYAYADLCGALQARNQQDIECHDWEAHKESILELEQEFDFINPVSHFGDGETRNW